MQARMQQLRAELLARAEIDANNLKQEMISLKRALASKTEVSDHEQVGRKEKKKKRKGGGGGGGKEDGEEEKTNAHEDASLTRRKADNEEEIGNVMGKKKQGAPFACFSFFLC